MHPLMGEHHYSTAILAAFGGFAGGFCVYLLTGYVMTDSAWCIVGEDHCVREWVSALSGWAATVAAAITIYFLFRQNEEQKRQTEFLLGDAMPSVDAIQHIKRRVEIVIRIVNWNRRPIIVDGLRIIPAIYNLEIPMSKIWDRDDPSSEITDRTWLNGKISPAIAMHGWKNRSGGPCEVRLDVAAEIATSLYESNWKDAEIELDIVIAGERNQLATLRCPIATVEQLPDQNSGSD